MKKITFTLFFLGCLMLAGCAHNPEKISDSAAKTLTDKMTYLKDTRTGICYAAVASRVTGSTDQESMTITCVPCTPEVEAQIVKK